MGVLQVLAVAKLTFEDMDVLTCVFSLKQGYVLDFTNRSFSEFLKDAVSVDAYSGEYECYGTSKAEILRAVLESLSDQHAATLIRALLAREKKYPNLDVYPLVSNEDRTAASGIADRLSNTTTDQLPELTLASSHEVFRRVRKEVDKYLRNKSYDAGLDRLHTFITLYLRLLVANAELKAPENDVPLHSLMGTYIKHLVGQGRQLSEMTLRILRSSISTLESFNQIRNDHSFAHPTEQLAGRDEAEFIFSHVIALVLLLEKLDSAVMDGKPK